MTIIAIRFVSFAGTYVRRRAISHSDLSGSLMGSNKRIGDMAAGDAIYLVCGKEIDYQEARAYSYRRSDSEEICPCIRTSLWARE